MSNNISQRIKNLRRDKGLTLEQVAEIVGVGKSTVRKWETGMITSMKQDKIPLLAKALGTTTDYLMGLDLQSQIDSLADEIAIKKAELLTADPIRQAELEYELAHLEESYEDHLLGLHAIKQEKAHKKISSDEPSLTEGEKVMLELFRQIPEDQQPMVLAMIRAALSGNK